MRNRNRHLESRQKNRAISDELLAIVEAHGRETYVGDGRAIVRLAPDLLEKLSKLYIVRSVSDGQVITAGHRFKRVRNS